jgi:DNA-binding beta-propeller fold protein YncE
MRRLKPHWPRCLSRREQGARKKDGCSPARSARWGLTLFVIYGAIGVPAFSFAGLIFKTPASIVACGCLLTALVLALILIEESEERSRSGAQRGVLVLSAIVLAVVGLASSLRAVTEETSEPTDKTVVTRGSSFRVGGDPIRLVVGPDGVLWVGDRKASIRSVDASLRQPIGASRRIGRRLLHDLEMISGFLFAIVDAGKVVRVDPSPTGGPPVTRRYGGGGGEIAPDGNSFWVNDRSSARVVRFSFDLKRLQTLVVNSNPKARATAIAVGGDGSLWVADASLNIVYKVSPVTEKVVLSTAVPERPESLLVIGEILFVAYPSLGLIERIKTTSGERLPGTMSIDLGPTLLAAAKNFLIVCNSKTSRLSPYSSSTGEPAGRELPVGVSPTDIDFGPNGEGWTVDSATGKVTPLELTAQRAPSRSGAAG